jgi:Kef-type K+ transport system membrane component KefB
LKAGVLGVVLVAASHAESPAQDATFAEVGAFDGSVADAGDPDAGDPDAGDPDAFATIAPAPLVTASPAPHPSTSAPTAIPSGTHLERPATVIKTILGILGLLALAYLGGHPIVRGWEERLGVSQAIAAGFPYVLLGMLARAPGIGILNDDVLNALSPLLRLGLGWMGFVYGLRFDIRLFYGLAAGTGRLVVLSTLLPFIMVLGASSLLLAAVSSEPLSLDSPTFARDALILGTAAAMTARGTARFLRSGETPGYAARVIRLEELAGMLGLAFVASFFRPQGTGVTWQLPGTAWFLLTVGLGATVGILVYAILQSSSRDGAKGPEFLVAALGSISFSSGLAAYLHLSSVVVAFIAGALLANFPGDYHARLRDTLRRLEKPIFLMSLVIVGALWPISDWRGWLLMPVFVGARLGGKWIATSHWAQGRDSAPLPVEDRYTLGFAPLGTLAIAIVINAQLLYPGGSIPLIVSAVLGGGVLTEIFVQWSSRRRGRPTSEIATETEAARETVT